MALSIFTPWVWVARVSCWPASARDCLIWKSIFLLGTFARLGARLRRSHLSPRDKTVDAVPVRSCLVSPFRDLLD